MYNTHNYYSYQYQYIQCTCTLHVIIHVCTLYIIIACTCTYTCSRDFSLLFQMILEKDCRIAELETSVNNLLYQLQEFQHLHESTKQSLNDTEGLLQRQRVNKVRNWNEGVWNEDRG